MNKINKKLVIRSERPQDYLETEYMTMKSFWNLHGPGCNEHLLVRKLRQSDIYLPELSRIAVLDDHVAGAIFYSKAVINYGDYRKEVLTFGPLCVDPMAQDYGIGTKLLNVTMELAKKAGYDAIVIFGEPGYYPKHGFVTCDKLGITTMDGANFDAFMGIELIPGALTSMSEKTGTKGKFEEGNLFEDLPMEEADEMAKEFPPLLKMKLPCQWNYENASYEKNGYEIIDAVHYKPAFKNLFNLYAYELSEYNPWLTTQISSKGIFLEDQVEEYFADPNKKPFVILCENRPAGFLVLSGYETEEADENCMDFEEFFIIRTYRGKGIAGDIALRILRQINLSCDFSVLKNNVKAIHFWEKLLKENSMNYTRSENTLGMWDYHVDL